MRKIAISAVALAGATAAIAMPAGAATAGPSGPVTVTKTGITIDTGIRCVTEPCPSHVVIPIPPGKV